MGKNKNTLKIMKILRPASLGCNYTGSYKIKECNMFWHFVCCKQDHFLYIYPRNFGIFTEHFDAFGGVILAHNMSSHFDFTNF